MREREDISVVKIAHIGDIHLDSPLTNLKDVKMSAERRVEMAETFFSVIDSCAAQKVDIVLLAGDIFDSEYINLATCRRIAQRMERERDMLFFIAPGNHDYIHPASIYRQVKWAENVTIFSKEEMEKVVLPNKGVCVWGAGFTAPSLEHSLLKGFCVEDPSWINIGVVHGELTSAPSLYHPITVEDIGHSKLDYLALGHIHTFSGILKAEETPYCYCGCLEPRGFDELGEKGFVIAEIEKKNSRFYFCPVAKRQYLEMSVDISGLKREEDICAAIQNKTGENTPHLYKIHLTGEVEEADTVDVSRIAQRLSSQYYFIKLADDTNIAREFFEIAKEKTLTGLFVGGMLQQIEQAGSEEEKQMWEYALRMGYNALQGREVVIG